MSLRARASHSLLAAALVPALLSGCNWFAPKAAKVRIKFVIYDNDNSRSLGRKLSELGGKQISVFEVPAGRSGFKVEIDVSSPIAVEGKLRR